MSIVTFWSSGEEQTGKTLSIAAISTYMAIEHNYKILLIDATFDNDALERCFWKVNGTKDVAKMLNKGKMDISSGAEGLVSAVASNKTTPEIITNYTKVVFKDRLEILLASEKMEEIAEEYVNLISMANMYYDKIFVVL